MNKIVLSLTLCGLLLAGLSASFEATAVCKPPAKHHDEDRAQAAQDCLSSGPAQPVLQVCTPVVDATTGVLVAEPVEECVAVTPLDDRP